MTGCVGCSPIDYGASWGRGEVCDIVGSILAADTWTCVERVGQRRTENGLSAGTPVLPTGNGNRLCRV